MAIQRTLVIKDRYLNIPVKTGAEKLHLTITVDGRAVRKFAVELADGKPDFWVFCDMQSELGKTAVISTESTTSIKPLHAIENSAHMHDEASFYHEKLRPMVHFSSRRGWNNDPNGLVYYKGEYHLFYQHNPYGWNWDNMHWGHAVSSDLFHWKEQPTAIYQFTQCKGMAFSGSAIVDENNTAGFQAGSDKALLAYLTDTESGEVLAYSNDAGLSWTLASENPVISHTGEERDPRVFWHEASKQFVVVVYRVEDSKQGLAFFTSKDLKKWERQSFIAGFFECPDMYQLPVDGNPAHMKWVLSAADGGYMIGDFDGHKFTPDKEEKTRFTWGNAFYAAQTYNNIPASDGRRIQIGWATAAAPDMPFNQCMNLPTCLSLRTTSQGVRLTPYPVKEFDQLRGRSYVHTNISVSANHPLKADLGAEAMDILINLSVPAKGWIIAEVRGIPVLYDAFAEKLYCQGCVAPLHLTDGKLELRIVVDRTIMEIFGNQGEVYMPVAAIADASRRAVTVSCSPTSALQVQRFEVHELYSIWER